MGYKERSQGCRMLCVIHRSLLTATPQAVDPTTAARHRKQQADPEPNLVNADGAREQEIGWGLGLFYGQGQPLQWKHIK